MIIVLEGPDGAGKSTMIEELKRFHMKQLGCSAETVQVWRAGPFPEGSDPWTEYVIPLSRLHATRDWLVLIDRWHLGELVYGPLLRGQSRLSPEQRAWIDGYLASLGALSVCLTATVEELMTRLAGRGDDLIKMHQLPYLVTRYEELTSHWPPTRIFNTTNQRVGPTAVAISLAADMEAKIAIVHRTHDNYDPRPYWEIYPWPS